MFRALSPNSPGFPIIFCLVTFFGASALAQLPIPKKKALVSRIGPGKKKQDPIAVATPFCRVQRAICNDVLETLKADLGLALYFKVLKNKTFIANMNVESLQKTGWKDWFNVGAHYLIKAQVSGSPRSIQLQLRLYNISDKKTYTLRTQNQSGLSRGRSLRAGVHKFVNEVLKTIHNVSGIFGSRIAYSTKTSLQTSGIFVISSDGRERYGIATRGINLLPAWLGGNVMYTSYRTGLPNIFVGNRKLSMGPGLFYKADASKSGRIAVAVSKGGSSDIYILSNGRLGRNLTRHPSDDLSPSWEPSGKRIAFVSNRSGGPQIFVMNSDGSGQRRLTFSGRYNTEPDFGPNNLVVFSMMIDGKYDIFTVDMSGKMSRITQNQGSNQSPTWSPNGQYLAFVSNRGGKKRIWISTADGRFQMPITKRSGGYRSLAWSN